LLVSISIVWLTLFFRVLSRAEICDDACIENWARGWLPEIVNSFYSMAYRSLLKVSLINCMSEILLISPSFSLVSTLNNLASLTSCGLISVFIQSSCLFSSVLTRSC
jgi:hypothetical protein